jgi:Leucine-rich repeat (LRR) protein
MHDLVHDLTQQIVQNELVLIPDKNTTDYNQRCRYLSIAPCTDKIDRKLFRKVRALYITGGGFATDKPIKKGCCVRSVILECVKDAFVPQFVLKFEYLAHLRISHLNCRDLPDAISSCWNLQSLHVIYCSNFAMLPESIGKLKKLRTLELSHSGDLESLPLSIGDCRSLESLQLIDCWKFRVIPDSICKNEMLRVLNIINCNSLRQLPSQSFATLQKLWIINLHQCTNLEELPSSLACVELRTLKLHKLKQLAILPQCIMSLNNLEHLDLGYCINLVELPQGIRKLKRLQVLNLEGCCKLRGLPAGFGHLRKIQRLGLFVIGGGREHARISELGNLDMISGLLEIAGIGYVNDAADVEKAYLKRKNNIKELKLDWLPGGNISEEMSMENLFRTNAEEELRVLNGLEPPCGIKKLEIFDYHGLHLPSWIIRERHSCNMGSSLKQTVDLCHFPCLTSMVLGYFPKVKHLARLVGLPSLKTLSLVSFGALESVSACPFPSLEKLHVAGMLQLLELLTTSEKTFDDGDGVIVCGNQAVQCCFPRLTSLEISNCPKLNVHPWFPASLTRLTLERCNEQLLFPVRPLCAVHPHGNELESPSCSNLSEISCLSLKKLELSSMTALSFGSSWELLLHLTALELLEIRGCSELRLLPKSLGSLTSLQRLIISDCCSLRELPKRLGELYSLQSLKIYNCGNLRELPEGIQYLTSLQHLHIEKCSAFHQLPEVGLGGLCSLRRLFIAELPILSCLPGSMLGLTSLEHVSIGLCHSLNRLPDQLGELRSLVNLAIWGLPALTCLPESMKRLTSLHELAISNCDALAVPMEWIGQLSALRSLQIICCHVITSLPSSMQHLTALHTLYISGYPDLARRCQQGVGEDWHLISHILVVNIS